MTTHDKDKIIAAAKKAGFFISNKQIFTAVLEHLPLTKNLERFYAIAFEAGAASRDAEIAELEREVERERMRLVACDVVAMSDTPSSAEAARKMHPDYESASCESVKRRVDECIALRKERDSLLADNARLRGKLAYAELILSKEYNHVVPSIVNALATTPEQSLARYHNEVLESAAKVCDEYAEREIPIAACAATIRSMKERE